MGKLIAIRHGQSVWNAENRFTGWVDIDLSEIGIQEAQKSGKLLKELNISFDICFTSYLKRAIKTLEIILRELGGENKYTKAWELNERHYGSLTGLNKIEMREKLGEEQFKKYRRSWDVPPPELHKNSKFNSLKDPLYKNLKEKLVNLEHYESNDFLELASIIKGAKLFIGNLSFGYALAEALKVPRLLESGPNFPLVYPNGCKAYDFYFQSHFESLVKKLYN